MSQLLRFRSGQSTTVIYGNGREPIIAQKGSRIGLKNYNITLQDTPSNSYVQILQGMNAINFGVAGNINENTITPGNYTLAQLVQQLQWAINGIVATGVDNTTTVCTYNDDGVLIFTTEDSPNLDDFTLDTLGAVLTYNPALPNIATAGTYNATASNVESTYQVASSATLAADNFSAVIGTLAGTFEVAAMLGDGVDTKLYGMGYNVADGQYIYYSNDVAVTWTGGGVPTAGDTFSWARTGSQIVYTVQPAGPAPAVSITVNLAGMAAYMKGYLEGSAGTQAFYTIQTTGANITTGISMVDTTDVRDIVSQFQCVRSELSESLGFGEPIPFISPNGAPAVITAPNPISGIVDYSGVIVCIGGLALKTYDLAPNAQGQESFLYNIFPTGSNTLVNEDLKTEFIEIRNETTNVNNKLTITLKDSASLEPLIFTSAELLVVLQA
jgi:hypothetical protein